MEDQATSKQFMENATVIREEIKVAERLKGTHDILHHRVKEIRQVIRLPYFEYRGDIFRNLVEKVIVKDKRNLRFIFKCGIEMDCKVA